MKSNMQTLRADPRKPNPNGGGHLKEVPPANPKPIWMQRWDIILLVILGGALAWATWLQFAGQRNKNVQSVEFGWNCGAHGHSLTDCRNAWAVMVKQ